MPSTIISLVGKRALTKAEYILHSVSGLTIWGGSLLWNHQNQKEINKLSTQEKPNRVAQNPQSASTAPTVGHK